jgi:IS30 family transposase
MKKSYRQLNIHERELLSILRGKGKSLREIANILKRSPSTLSRELQRNAPEIYKGYYLSQPVVPRSCETQRPQGLDVGAKKTQAGLVARDHRRLAQGPASGTFYKP